ncbi:hypothetical protein [Saccharicrinis fermentans]|nr:hypothetical protein [Saccharicrinis fermentans]
MLILGSMSMAAVLTMYLVFKTGGIHIFEPDSLNMIKSLVIIALLVGIPVSHIFYHKKIKHINESLKLAQKIAMFRVAFIVRIVMLEGIGLLSTIGYLVTADKSFLYMFGVVFILFIIHAPTRQRISSDLALSEEDKEALN